MLALIRDYFSTKKMLKEFLVNNNNYRLGHILSLYRMFCDNKSRKLFAELFTNKAIKKVPREIPRYLDEIIKIQRAGLEYGDLDIESLNLRLPLLVFSDSGYRVSLNTTAETFAEIFVQRKYEYVGQNFICKPQYSDVIIDTSANWGDSTLYFSQETGREGKVYSFISMPEYSAFFQNNLNYNPHLSAAIQITREALKQTSLDSYVKGQKIERVDFVKFEMNGSELGILSGAKYTLKKFRPKLAIDFCYNQDDFITMLSYLWRLRFRYRFYLSDYIAEDLRLVLFAMPRRKKKIKPKSNLPRRIKNKVLRLSGIRS